MNDNDEWIWFDDLSISRYKRDTAEIIQEDQYDPLGQILTDLSYRKANETENNNLYNAGSEWQKDLQWYGTFYRQYDPQLGRFHQSDPAADLYHSLTPYQYAANNALLYNDPLGDRLPAPKPRAICDECGGGGSGGGGSFRNVFFGNPFTNGFMGGNGNAYGYYGGGSVGSNFMAGRTNSFTAMSNERWDNHYGSGKAINESLAQTFGVFYYGSTAHQYVKYSPNGNVSMYTGNEVGTTADGKNATFLNYSPVSGWLNNVDRRAAGEALLSIAGGVGEISLGTGIEVGSGGLGTVGAAYLYTDGISRIAFATPKLFYALTGDKQQRQRIAPINIGGLVGNMIGGPGSALQNALGITNDFTTLIMTGGTGANMSTLIGSSNRTGPIVGAILGQGGIWYDILNNGGVINNLQKRK